MNKKYFLIRHELVLLTMIAEEGRNSDGAAFQVYKMKKSSVKKMLGLQLRVKELLYS